MIPTGCSSASSTATPAGAQRNMNVKMIGMNIIIFCCAGSAPVGRRQPLLPHHA